MYDNPTEDVATQLVLTKLLKQVEQGEIQSERVKYMLAVIAESGSPKFEDLQQLIGADRLLRHSAEMQAIAQVVPGSDSSAAYQNAASEAHKAAHTILVDMERRFDRI